jgi:ring-1,2-phenylacetyl-CoA epoxidase subunit PaaB
VVASNNVFASDAAEADAFYDPANSKVYRHPTFYDIPDGISHM